MKIVCVTGLPACGKEEFLKIALSKGFAVIRMGDVVREEAGKKGFPIRDPEVGEFADLERKKFGFGIWAQRTLPRIVSELSLVDGIRGLAEIEVYQSAFPRSLHVVAIHASPTTRLRRILRRNRLDDPVDEEDFRARDKRELGWGLGNVMALADHVIVNEGDLASFTRQAAAILEKILTQGNRDVRMA